MVSIWRYMKIQYSIFILGVNIFYKRENLLCHFFSKEQFWIYQVWPEKQYSQHVAEMDAPTGTIIWIPISLIDAREHPAETMSGWWFGTRIFIFPYIGNFIIPTDELIFFRGVGWNHQPDVCDPIILPWFPSKVFLHINPVMTVPIIWWMGEGNSLCEAPMFGGHFTIPNCSMMLHVWFSSMCLHIYSDMTGSYITSMYASWISMYATCS